jgi:hypothetical protein
MNHYTATFHGLHDWHKHIFQHLGWMILAKEHKKTLKVRAYVDEINRFEKALKEKIYKTTDIDRRDDLYELLEHSKILKKYSSKLFRK